jgi:hypothetical protein
MGSKIKTAYCISVGKTSQMVAGPFYSLKLALEEIGDTNHFIVKVEQDKKDKHLYKWDDNSQKWRII